jgi:hypothetical protein
MMKPTLWLQVLWSVIGSRWSVVGEKNAGIWDQEVAVGGQVSGGRDQDSAHSCFLGNSLESSSTYHTELLRRMRLEIPGVRPAALSSEISFQHLEEMRGFRHVFCHAYSYGLDDERVFFLLRQALESKDTILGDISSFRSHIEGLQLSD